MISLFTRISDRMLNRLVPKAVAVAGICNCRCACTNGIHNCLDCEDCQSGGRCLRCPYPCP
jgi:hypothetical protein